MTWDMIGPFLTVALVLSTAMLLTVNSQWAKRALNSEKRARAWRTYAVKLEAELYTTLATHSDPGTLSDYRSARRQESLPAESEE